MSGEPKQNVIGAGVRRARLDAGLTQAEAAVAIQLATGVYSRLERGRMRPSVATLTRLCRALGVSADTLLGLRAIPIQTVPGLNDVAARRLLRRIQGLLPRQLRVVGLLVTELNHGTRRGLRA